MRVIVYPADMHGCGHHRLIWPVEELRKQGHEITLVNQDDRVVKFSIENGNVVDIELPHDTDVVVFQRITHLYLRQVIPLLRQRGIATVIDVDDDLTSMHSDNPAWERLHPKNFGRVKKGGERHMHSWHHLSEACREATLVTATTSPLLDRYATHGRGVILENYLAPHYYTIDRHDSDTLVWPASLHSHPDDPTAVGNAVSRLVSEGTTFTTYGEPMMTAKRFGLTEPTHDHPQSIKVDEWPEYIAQHGVAIVPLTNTKFNAAKSWLKPLELSAVGVPWVGSPRAEYRRLHEMGCGVLAEKPKHWYRVLKQLLTDERYRKELTDAGYEVAAQLKLEDHAWRWWDAWQYAVELERA